MLSDKLMSPAVNRTLVGVAVGTAIFGPVIDLGAGRNQGLMVTPNTPGWLVTFDGATSAGAATLAVQVATSANADGSSATVLYTSPTLTLAQGAGKGTQFFIPVPDSFDWKRYCVMRVTVGTAVFTAGNLSIEYIVNKRAWHAYPSADTI